MVAYGVFILRRTDLRGRKVYKRFFRNDIAIEHTRHSYILKKRSWFSSDLVIQEYSELLGTIWRKAVLRIGAETSLTTKIPLEIRVFMLWLAFVIWSRHGGGGNGG